MGGWVGRTEFDKGVGPCCCLHLPLPIPSIIQLQLFDEFSFQIFEEGKGELAWVALVCQSQKDNA